MEVALVGGERQRSTSIGPGVSAGERRGKGTAAVVQINNWTSPGSVDSRG
jgi:hypothetical protein